MVGINIKRRLGPKGQIVIPKDIRSYFGLVEGSNVIFEIIDGKIILKPEKEPEVFIKEFCTTNKKLSRKIDLKKLLDEQIEGRHE